MTDTAFSLRGRVAVVTGAASGLGEEIARTFAAAGATVAGVDVDENRNRAAAEAIGGAAFTADVSDAEAIEETIARIESELGRVDVLVNSAGVAGRGPAERFDRALLDSLIDINLKGSLYTCQAVGRRMLEDGAGGSIVNIASIGGLVGFPGSVGYQASKGAVVQMTRTLAVEWAPDGIRVNAVAPGHIGTEMVKAMWQVEPELKEFFLSRTPLDRLGEPIDVALPVLFLASDAAAMVTGQILVVDGGYTTQ